MDSRGAIGLGVIFGAVALLLLGAILYSAFLVSQGGIGFGQQLCLSATGQTVPCSMIPFQAGGTAPTAPGTVATPPTATGPSTNPSISFAVNDFKTGSALDANGLLYFTAFATSSGQLPTDWSGLRSEVTKSSSDTFSNLSSNQPFSLVIGNTGSTFTFYPTVINGVLPNTGPFPITARVRQAATTVATTTIYQEDDVTANTVSAKTALGASDTATFRIWVQPAASTNNNLFFSDGVLGPTIVFDKNVNTIRNIYDVSEDGPMGRGMMVPVGTPSGHTVEAVGLSSIAYQMVLNKTFAPGQNYYIRGTIESTATDPTTTSNLSDINATVYDGCLIENTLNGSWTEGYRNPVSLADACGTNITDTIHIS